MLLQSVTSSCTRTEAATIRPMFSGFGSGLSQNLPPRNIPGVLHRAAEVELVCVWMTTRA